MHTRDNIYDTTLCYIVYYMILLYNLQWLYVYIRCILYS